MHWQVCRGPDLWSDVVGASHNVGEDLAGMVEDREAKVSSLQWSMWVLVGQQEILRLQVPVSMSRDDESC